MKSMWLGREEHSTKGSEEQADEGRPELEVRSIAGVGSGDTRVTAC